MPFFTVRPSGRQDAKPLAVIILIVASVIGLQFVIRLGVLNRAERFAVEEAVARTDAAAGAVAEGFGRQIDSWTRLRYFMSWIASGVSGGAPERGYIGEPLGRLAADPQFAISSASLVWNGSAWHLGAGPEAPPQSGTPPAPGADSFAIGRPVTDSIAGLAPGNWLIPLAYAPRAASAGAIGVISLDGRRLSGVLARFEGRPGQRVALWRGDGTFLAGTYKAGEMVAAQLVSTLRPSLAGREVQQTQSPFDGEARFVALRALPGQDMFITLSVSRAAEMAQFLRMEQIAVWLEGGMAVGMAGCAIVIIGAARARARTQLSLAATEADRKRAQEVQDTQREVLEGVDAGVYTLQAGPGDHYQRQDFNTGTARLIRRSVEELRAVRGVMAFAEPQASPKDQRAVMHDLIATGAGAYETRIRCGDGELRWFRFQLRVTRREGEVMHCIGLMTDIETEKAAAASAVLAARLATLGELSAGIAHEMKQPLAAISLIAETAEIRLQSAAPPPAIELLPVMNRISRLAERASSVTDHLRGIARNQDGGETNFNVAEAVEGAMLMCGFALRQDSVAVEIDIPAGVPRMVGHQVLAEQVLMNLFMNARDAMAAMPRGDRHLRIAAVAENERVRLTVRDSGPGIPDQVMPRLFEAFFTTKPRGAGTGLGLSICASILKACGGSISAATPGGGGAEFTITLLAVPASTAAIAA